MFKKLRSRNAALSLLLSACLLVTMATSACSTEDLVRAAETTAGALADSRPAIQVLIDGGLIDSTKGAAILKKVSDGADIATRLKTAFLNKETATPLQLTAELSKLIEGLIRDDLSGIKNDSRKTLALAIVAAADIAINQISRALEKKAREAPAAVKVALTAAASADEVSRAESDLQVVAETAKRAVLRARDSKTGRFVSLDYAREHPDTTTVERVERKQ